MPKDAKKLDSKKQASKKQDSKNKKHFMKDFKAELKRVIWPTPKQLVNNTVAVITVVLITAVIVFVLDFVFESMNTYGIDKLKEVVDTSYNSLINGLNAIDLDSAIDETNELATDTNTTNETTNQTTNEVAN